LNYKFNVLFNDYDIYFHFGFDKSADCYT